jgi:AraC-like DNA-binding protein
VQGPRDEKGASDQRKDHLTGALRWIQAEVCFAVGRASLGTFSSRFTDLIGMPPSTYRRHAAGATAVMPSWVANQVTRPVRNQEAPAPSRS